VGGKKQKTKKKHERGGRFKIKINILFCGDNSRNSDLGQITFGAAKRYGHSLQALLEWLRCSAKLLNMGDGAKF
jgi:hypothetical protein